MIPFHLKTKEYYGYQPEEMALEAYGGGTLSWWSFKGTRRLELQEEPGEKGELSSRLHLR